MKERVQKLMAQANIASRRAAEAIILEGRVKVNGQVVGLGDKADPLTDIITVDGERLKFSAGKRYIAYNKPNNVLSAPASDHDDDRPTVRQMIPQDGHLFTIGRLDAESDGLIVLTDDGELANQLMHPRYQHTKTYKVTIYGAPDQDALDRWERGVFLEEGRTAPCSIRVQARDAETTTLRIVMIEGKKRQIRRVAGLLGFPVKKLTRTHIGQLALGTLRRGEWVELTPEDVEAMKTPASDLSYIKKLKRELRAERGRGLHARPPMVDERAQTPERERVLASASESRPRRSFNRRDEGDEAPRPRRPAARPGSNRRDEDDAPRPRRPAARPGSNRRDEDDAPRPRRPAARPGSARRDEGDDAPRPRRPAARPGSNRRDEDDAPRPRKPARKPGSNRPAAGSEKDAPKSRGGPKPSNKPGKPGGSRRPANRPAPKSRKP
jgi:pseudouridine synthase